MSASGFDKGLVELADGVHAYLQPDGSWGWSNSGVVIGDGQSLLVDTLFDIKLTAEMLQTMEPHVARAPISTVVNTHANGDHCYGNQLLAGSAVDFVASEAARHEMEEIPPSTMAMLVKSVPGGNLARFLQHAFGPFDFEGIEIPPVTTTFTGTLDLDIAGVRAELRVVGPAHTRGDLIVWLPDQQIVFAGDILFVGGTPIMWAGPIGNWIAACDLITDLEPNVIVPGHGPLTDTRGVADVAEYLTFVRDAVGERHEAGMTPVEASRDIDVAINGTRFAHWSDRERLVVTVHAAWRELEPDYQAPDALSLLRAMADDFASRTGPSS